MDRPADDVKKKNQIRNETNTDTNQVGHVVKIKKSKSPVLFQMSGFWIPAGLHEAL